MIGINSVANVVSCVPQHLDEEAVAALIHEKTHGRLGGNQAFMSDKIRRIGERGFYILGRQARVAVDDVRN